MGLGHATGRDLQRERIRQPCARGSGQKEAFAGDAFCINHFVLVEQHLEIFGPPACIGGDSQAVDQLDCRFHPVGAVGVQITGPRRHVKAVVCGDDKLCLVGKRTFADHDAGGTANCRHSLAQNSAHRGSAAGAGQQFVGGFEVFDGNETAILGGNPGAARKG